MNCTLSAKNKLQRPLPQPTSRAFVCCVKAFAGKTSKYWRPMASISAGSKVSNRCHSSPKEETVFQSIFSCNAYTFIFLLGNLCEDYKIPFQYFQVVF